MSVLELLVDLLGKVSLPFHFSTTGRGQSYFGIKAGWLNLACFVDLSPYTFGVCLHFSSTGRGKSDIDIKVYTYKCYNTGTIILKFSLRFSTTSRGKHDIDIKVCWLNLACFVDLSRIYLASICTFPPQVEGNVTWTLRFVGSICFVVGI